MKNQKSTDDSKNKSDSTPQLFYSKPYGYQKFYKDTTKNIHDDPNEKIVDHTKICKFLKPKGSPEDLYSFPEFYSSFQVEKFDKKGRGIIATQKILPGQLIMAAKALAIVFPQQDSSTSKLLREMRKLALLRESISELVKNDPKIREKVYELYAGPNLGYLTKDEIPQNIDTERIERICSFNAFQGSVQGTNIDGKTLK